MLKIFRSFSALIGKFASGRGPILAALLLFFAHAAGAAERRNVAVLVWPGAELLDFSGPCEVFFAAGRHRLFNVYLVGLDRRPVRTQGGVTVLPDYTLGDCPRPDVTVVPGGNMQPVEGRADVLEWVRHNTSDGQVMLSVCTGAFVLAEAGLLDGLSATTHHFGYEEFARRYPKVRVDRTARYVDNGRVITAGGVSAGIDAALHVVERLAGHDEADWTAREWMEYRASVH
ncbi:MAG TPA: DJ-1/PfpI family protein [Candidatus Didemnitutus sp.]|jgi:transcriptional regulator GlxA family with amidase domain